MDFKSLKCSVCLTKDKFDYEEAEWFHREKEILLCKHHKEKYSIQNDLANVNLLLIDPQQTFKEFHKVLKKQM